MIGRSIGALLVVGSGLGLVACGGKAKGGPGFEGGAGMPGEQPPLSPPGSHQTPPPTYETPPPTYEPPPPTYEHPDGASTEACTAVCNAFVNATCAGQIITAEDMAACPGECQTAFAEFEPCVAEFGAVLTCMLRTSFFQDLIDAACSGEDIEPTNEDLEEVALQCGALADAYNACAGTVGPEPGEGGCNLDNQCVECPNACAQCQCLYGPSAEQCMVVCNPPA
jgi:hypothetical protein